MYTPLILKRKKKKKLFIYFYWLHCVSVAVPRPSLVTVIWDYSLIAMLGLLFAVVSLVVDAGSRALEFQ